jgi:hypothetical protein
MPVHKCSWEWFSGRLVVWLGSWTHSLHHQRPCWPSWVTIRPPLRKSTSFWVKNLKMKFTFKTTFGGDLLFFFLYFSCVLLCTWYRHVDLLNYLGCKRLEVGLKPVFGVLCCELIWVFMVRNYPVPPNGTRTYAIAWWCSHKLTARGRIFAWATQPTSN